MKARGIFNGPRSRVSVSDAGAQCPSFPWLLTCTGFGGSLKRRFANPVAAVERARRVARSLRADGASVLVEIADAARS